jgi:hypothetical protein
MSAIIRGAFIAVVLASTLVVAGCGGVEGPTDPSQLPQVIVAFGLVPFFLIGVAGHSDLNLADGVPRMLPATARLPTRYGRISSGC